MHVCASHKRNGRGAVAFAVADDHDDGKSNPHGLDPYTCMGSVDGVSQLEISEEYERMLKNVELCAMNAGTRGNSRGNVERFWIVEILNAKLGKKIRKKKESRRHQKEKKAPHFFPA